MAGVRRFEDLIAWQRANELKEEIFAFTSTPPCSRDLEFCDQIRDSARSAPSNIAESFGRYYPKEMIRFLRYAAASLHETKNHLHDGKSRHYISDSTHTRLIRLNLRAIKATNRWIAYLRTAKPPNSENP
jgi:four helix bundle protein